MHRPSSRNAIVFAAILALVSVLSVAPGALARPHVAERDEIAVAALPREARVALALIHAGGPFPFERDGATFGNREHSLPPRTRGYYHEYTVGTPGARTRGARRIVCGGPPRTPEVCYYSDDHYATFGKIRE